MLLGTSPEAVLNFSLTSVIPDTFFFFSKKKKRMWSVFLIANVRDSPITEFEIHSDQNPDAYVYWLNRFVPPFNQRWIVLQRIRLPENVSNTYAQFVRDMWRKKTRSLQRYIAKSFYLSQFLVSRSQANLELTPWQRCEHEAVIEPYYNNHTLDWPPIPLHILIERRESNGAGFTSSSEREYKRKHTQLDKHLQKENSIADIIRMVDIQVDAVKTLPNSLLERFIKVLTTTT